MTIELTDGMTKNKQVIIGARAADLRGSAGNGRGVRIRAERRISLVEQCGTKLQSVTSEVLARRWIAHPVCLRGMSGRAAAGSRS